MLNKDQKLAIYMEGELAGDFAKMCHGILRYSPNEIAAIIDSHYAGKNVQDVVASPRSVPVVGTIDEAIALGARAFVLGIALPGGHIPESWYPAIDEAVAKGLSVVNGLHDRLSPRYLNVNEGQWIWDIRVEPAGLETGTGAARTLNNKRVLFIGTDMAIGKMTAGLELYRVAKERGIRTGFVATGQIGITIMGSGIPLDAIRVDYASGAVEREVMSLSDEELVIVEGQGALLHPSSSATLPLLRGSCPTHLILCHKARQTTLRSYKDISIPPLLEYIKLYEDLAEVNGTYPRPKTVAICLNTSALSECEARNETMRILDETGLPAVDPVTGDPGLLLTALVKSPTILDQH